MVRRKMISSQIIGATVITLIVSTSVLLFFTTKLVNSILNQVLIEHLNTTKTTILKSIQRMDETNRKLENVVDKQLLIVLRAIALQLVGKTVDEVSQQELLALKKRFRLDGISLLHREKDDIVIRRTTEAFDLGLSTNQWKKDPQANVYRVILEHLFERKTVNVGVGYYEKDYWVSPITFSTKNPNQYFKFAYYYDGTTDFIISGFVRKEFFTEYGDSSTVNQLIHELTEQTDILEEISIIYPSTWLSDPEEIRYPAKQSPILYGTYHVKIPQDREMVIEASRTKKEMSVETPWNQFLIRKFYIPLPNGQMMLIAVNMNKFIEVKRQLPLLLISSTGVTMIMIFVVIRWLTKRRLRPMDAIQHHLNLISEGDFSGRLDIKDRNELGFLADRINEMTDKMGVLVAQINEQADEKINFTQSTYHQELENLLTSVKSIRHDFQNHMAVVAGLIQIGNTEKALEYIREISKEVHKITQFLQIKNPQLSVFFNSKITIAHHNHIQIESQIESDTYDVLPTLDQIKIYGNLIDNAFDEVLKFPPEQRKVNIVLRREPSFYYFRVENTGEAIPEHHLDKLFELGFSTKSNGNSRTRGTGLSIVKQTVEGYKGQIHVYRKNNMTCFEVVIPLMKREKINGKG